jgi:uncharacterized protein YcbK (DUF882 family)
MKLSAHFSLAEFISPNDPNRPNQSGLANLRELAAVLEIIRARAGRPLKITSGYRSPSYNRAIGGAAMSLHTTGMACDIEAPGDMLELAALTSQIAEIGGVGVYPGRGFIHVDIRRRPENAKAPTWWAQVNGAYGAVPKDLVSKIRKAGGNI